MGREVEEVNWILIGRSKPLLSKVEEVVVTELAVMAVPKPSSKTLALYIRLRRIEHRHD
jgi:hypothetical protein